MPPQILSINWRSFWNYSIHQNLALQIYMMQAILRLEHISDSPTLILWVSLTHM